MPMPERQSLESRIGHVKWLFPNGFWKKILAIVLASLCIFALLIEALSLTNARFRYGSYEGTALLFTAGKLSSGSVKITAMGCICVITRRPVASEA